MTNKEKNFISVIIYVHNCVQNTGGGVSGFLLTLKGILDNRFESYEIICVNDDSKDNSRKVLEEFAKEVEHTPISIVNMSYYHGIELAMNAGVDLSIGDFIIEIDNWQEIIDKLEYVNKVYDKCLEGNDIVALAPRNVKNIFSKLFYKVYNANVLSKDGQLQQECLRVVSRRAINRAYTLNRKVGYRKAVYANCGLKRETIFYDNTNNGHRYSKQEKVNRQELAIESLVLYTNLIQKISSVISAFFLGITICIGIYIIGVYFSYNKPIEGWTSMMLFLSLGFTGIFLMFTITLKYLSIILKQIFEKQKYLVESITKLTNN